MSSLMFSNNGTIGGWRISILVNNGSTHNFLNYTKVKKLGLPQVPNSHTYILSLINRDDHNVWDKAIMGVQLELQDHIMHLDFHAMH